jgi:hypothetical protein
MEEMVGNRLRARSWEGWAERMGYGGWVGRAKGAWQQMGESNRTAMREFVELFLSFCEVSSPSC